MTEPAKPAAAAATAATKDVKEEKPPEPRPMLPAEPEFELSPNTGTGWYTYRSDAPAELSAEAKAEAAKAPKAPEEEKPPQPVKSETGKIEGTVEAESLEEAKAKIVKAYPGARFKNPAATPAWNPKA